MRTLFGRSCAPGHCLENDLDPLLAPVETDCLKRSVAENLQYDDRVSRPRETAFLDFVRNWRAERQKAGDYPDFEACVKQYFETKIRTRELPEFVYRALNRDNTDSAANRYQKLVRVLDLSELWTPLSGIASESAFEEVFSDFPSDIGDYPEWLEGWMSGGESSVEKLIPAVLDGLALAGKERAFQPTWATFLDHFKTCMNTNDADRWMQALGLWPRPSHWLVLLSYEIRSFRTLVRPTQLDAGWNGLHFPSPASIRAPLAGYPMDRGGAREDTPLLPEVVHRSIVHSLSHWDNAGRKYRKTSSDIPVSADGPKQYYYRLTHWCRLLYWYGSAVADWMPEPQPVHGTATS